LLKKQGYVTLLFLLEIICVNLRNLRTLFNQRIALWLPRSVEALLTDNFNVIAVKQMMHFARKTPFGKILHRAADGCDFRSIDSGVNSHLFQHKNQIFGSDIAGGALNKGAASHSPEGAAKMRNVHLQRGQRIGQPFAFCVVQMEINGFVLCQGPGRTADLLDGTGICHTGGICQLDFIDAQSQLLFYHVLDDILVDPAFIAASKDALEAPAYG
jgi:hypothetical protein